MDTTPSFQQSSIVTVEKIVYGGVGLARTEAGVVFVRGALPGERVRIVAEGRKGGALHARVEEVLEPSPDRRSPPCPYAGECGGCDWLHIAYEEQLTLKKEIVADCFTRIGRLGGIPDIEIVAAAERGYRMRAQLKIDSRSRLGFFRRRTNDVVAVGRCELLVDTINALLSRTGLAFPDGTQSVKVIAGDDSALASAPTIAGSTAPEVQLSVGDRKFVVAGDSFFQGNRFLVERLGNWAGPHMGGRCVDLYGGAGFFAVMNSGRFTGGILIESVAAQVAQARRNFRLNGMGSSWEARTAPAERIAQELKGWSPHTIIIDPPRPGLTRTVREAVGRLRPSTILYVSCNPSTQARDLGYLVNRIGYTVSRAAVFDLYPNTHHIETAVVLHLP